MLDAQNVNIISSKYGRHTAMCPSHGRLGHSSDPPVQVLRHSDRRPQLKRCPPSVRTFTGRNDILAQMQEYFFNGSRNQHIFVLYGLGGAGKTQIAFKFVEMCQGEAVPKWVWRKGDIWTCALDL